MPFLSFFFSLNNEQENNEKRLSQHSAKEKDMSKEVIDHERREKVKRLKDTELALATSEEACAHFLPQWSSRLLSKFKIILVLIES